VLFQSGKFDAGQSVDYRVDGERLYILHDNDKEYKCKIEGTRAVEVLNPTLLPPSNSAFGHKTNCHPERSEGPGIPRGIHSPSLRSG